jgi:hypothetical protein
MDELYCKAIRLFTQITMEIVHRGSFPVRASSGDSPFASRDLAPIPVLICDARHEQITGRTTSNCIRPARGGTNSGFESVNAAARSPMWIRH